MSTYLITIRYKRLFQYQKQLGKFQFLSCVTGLVHIPICACQFSSCQYPRQDSQNLGFSWLKVLSVHNVYDAHLLYSNYVELYCLAMIII